MNDLSKQLLVFISLQSQVARLVKSFILCWRQSISQRSVALRHSINIFMVCFVQDAFMYFITFCITSKYKRYTIFQQRVSCIIRILIYLKSLFFVFRSSRRSSAPSMPFTRFTAPTSTLTMSATSSSASTSYSTRRSSRGSLRCQFYDGYAMYHRYLSVRPQILQYVRDPKYIQSLLICIYLGMLELKKFSMCSRPQISRFIQN